jgi:hypothetical protein
MLVMRRVGDARACSVARWSARLEDSANALLAKNAQIRVAGAASVYTHRLRLIFPLDLDTRHRVAWQKRPALLHYLCERNSTSHSSKLTGPVKERLSASCGVAYGRTNVASLGRSRELN